MVEQRAAAEQRVREEAERRERERAEIERDRAEIVMWLSREPRGSRD